MFKSKVLIANFHDIESLSGFKKIIHSIGKYYDFIDNESLHSFIYKKNRIRSACHLTFDDGYKSFFNLVLPFLKKNKIPATLFVSPKSIVNNSNFWFQEFSYLKNNIPESYFKNYIKSFFNNSEYSKDFIKNLKLAEINSLLDYLKKQSKIEISEKFNINLDQFNIINSSKLIAIGAHTQNHPILSNENYETAELEIKESINDLEKISDSKVKNFAYPNGSSLDFGNREVNILKSLGISLAFTTKPKVVTHLSKPYRIPRIGFSSNYSKYDIFKILFPSLIYFTGLTSYSKSKSKRSKIE